MLACREGRKGDTEADHTRHTETGTTGQVRRAQRGAQRVSGHPASHWEKTAGDSGILCCTARLKEKSPSLWGNTGYESLFLKR